MPPVTNATAAGEASAAVPGGGASPPAGRATAPGQATSEPPEPGQATSARREEATAYLGPVTATPPYVVDAFVALAGVGPGDVVADLGCSDARVLVGALSESEGTCGMGVELDAGAHAKAVASIASAGLGDRINLILGDAANVDISGVTALYLYTFPTGMQKMRPKLEAELKPGTRVVSFMFAMKGWERYLTKTESPSKPGKKMDVSGVTKLYLYTIPASFD